MKNPLAKPAQLSKAYGSASPLSTDHVRAAAWNALRIALLVVIGIIVSGAALSIAGVGNPTYGWRASEAAQLITAGQRGGSTLWQLSPTQVQPFIIEASLNEPASWGLWLGDGVEQQLLVDPRGFISYGPDIDWRPFIHAHPGVNRLLLQVESDGKIVWRVNDEIAWAGQLEYATIEAIGIMAPANVSSDDLAIRLYSRP